MMVKAMNYLFATWSANTYLLSTDIWKNILKANILSIECFIESSYLILCSLYNIILRVKWGLLTQIIKNNE